MIAKKCGEGVGRAWICLSGVEDGACNWVEAAVARISF